MIMTQDELGGERDSFAQLVRRHHANILWLCASLLGDRTLADDAAQEIFLKAYQSLGSFKGSSSFSSWLYRIASNHCLDLLRRKTREKTQSLDALLENNSLALERLIQAAPDAALSTENADLLERVLSSLAPEYRLILTLREISGLNYEELAQTLDCSLDAVKGRLKRARRQLEEILRHLSKSGNV
ncbi:MAG: hypothetical protein A3J74_08005 [Elusimicrobia bacterium RIFCSPHIGHO2_02_FULL_57_9]|nr:MAG: hypothetical protein A3J74_08005 [Elusimicrobia bacterium RIFCSPHIGHO2_02_FULL_57_9]